MNSVFFSTIAAISTAFGKGATAKIRISGENAFEVANKMLVSPSGNPIKALHAKAYHANVIDKSGVAFDDCIAIFFHAPNSYTGENMVEIDCHGGVFVTEAVLKRAYECGATPAKSGEFTRRAFVNGKITLSESEAVGQAIDAFTENKMYLAQSQKSGALSKKIDEIYADMISVCAAFQVRIDYPDEDLSPLTDDEILSKLNGFNKRLSSLLDTHKAGKAINEGIATVICGKPNVGKSALLNRLLGEDRAIVTEIAGTTRDAISENCVVGKLALRLTDTAGIRETDDIIEKIGIEKARQTIDNAELVLAVFDISRKFDNDDKHFLEILKNVDREKIIVLLNKCDLPHIIDKSVFDGISGNIIEISAKDDIRIEKIGEIAEEIFAIGKIDVTSDAIITNSRQYSCIFSANEAILSAISSVESGLGADCAIVDMENALACLGEVDGRSVTVDVVDEIFRHFCVGK